MFFARGAEFSRSHEDDVGDMGKLVERSTVEQITGDGFDAVSGEFGREFVIREPRYREHTLLDACLLNRTPRKTGQAWTHLATDAEDEKIAVQRRHRRCGLRVGAREQFFQF